MAFDRNAVRLIQLAEPHNPETYNRPLNDLMDQIESGNLFNVYYNPEAYLVPSRAAAEITITIPRPSSRVQVFIDGRLLPPSYYVFTPDTTVITMNEAYEPNEEVVVYIDPIVNDEPVPAVPEALEITGQSGNALVLPRVVTFVMIFIDGRFISPANYQLTPASGSNTVSLNFDIETDDVVVVHII